MTGSTNIKRLAGAAAALAAAAAVVPSALAAGEPKNQPPFTRIVTARGLAQDVVRSHASASLVIAGDAKNQLPFTRR